MSALFPVVNLDLAVGNGKAELGFRVTKVREPGGRACLSCPGAAAHREVCDLRAVMSHRAHDLCTRMSCLACDLCTMTSHRAHDLGLGSCRNRD